MHKGQLTQKFNGERHADTALLPQGHIISLMKDQLVYTGILRTLNFIKLALARVNLHYRKHSSKWYMLSSAILTRSTIYFHSTDPLEDK
jgi:hypothetical protein